MAAMLCDKPQPIIVEIRLPTPYATRENALCYWIHSNKKEKGLAGREEALARLKKARAEIKTGLERLDERIAELLGKTGRRPPQTAGEEGETEEHRIAPQAHHGRLFLP